MAATRKSIRKYFPLGVVLSRGNDNPITLHAVHDDVFRSIWSVIAETMVVDGALQRTTKESIATFVSKKNACPVCITAHRMMGTAANRAEDKKVDENLDAAIQYAEIVQQATLSGSDPQPLLSTLSDKAKAEVALVVLVFEHMNRVVSAIMGEEMSTAMFSVPRPVARKMESHGVMKVMSIMMAPFLSTGLQKKRAPGITSSLFRDQQDLALVEQLPAHLRGVELAGEERAQAVARLNALVENLYASDLEKSVPAAVVDFLDDPENAPPADMPSHNYTNWAMIAMRPKVKLALGDGMESLVISLFLVQYSPKSVYRATDFASLTQELGKQQARLIVIWWSLRTTLAKAKGF